MLTQRFLPTAQAGPLPSPFLVLFGKGLSSRKALPLIPTPPHPPLPPLQAWLLQEPLSRKSPAV